ncbi:hypothetical protein CO615_05390 [Lysobacteraceae bacterium NML75-0749]|nr:hypothetical protein CO615_05390 [Xanthomonadaceae bacterium NML75-0749]PJK04887.1 hypothetical protein CO609_04360 [Xanthomonadaceae bacterium NML91-0268]
MTRLLFSTQPDAALGTELTRLRSLPKPEPFAPELRDFVCEFSRRVMALPQLRQYPELATLAHWFRPAALAHLAERVSPQAQRRQLARGLVFHLAPANVDVLFAYAWLLSLLCGNVNIARLSQKPAAQRDALISILHAMAQEPCFAPVAARSVFLTYPHNAAITAEISAACHARIIWGGDQTVATIRAIPLAPLAVELAFPDRFGVSAFKATALLALSDTELAELTRRFCNDTLWFGQQACSSPRSLYWVGSLDEVHAAQQRFWPVLRQQAHNGFPDEPAALLARIADAHVLAAQSPTLQLRDTLSDYPLRLQDETVDATLREQQSGYGLLIETRLNTLPELAALLDDRDQTLVQLGFTQDELDSLLTVLHHRAIDRIVPVGRALDFDPVWDGIDLLHILTRHITLPAH